MSYNRNNHYRQESAITETTSYKGHSYNLKYKRTVTESVINWEILKKGQNYNRTCAQENKNNIPLIRTLNG